ncbi:hypothetical protein [Streptomyces sp. HUAS TT20]|uniref:hypothetical protein n=1 Tax=Streptomyces sp. HUAS TT20 TaxID=3447509 RepID=UPI0021D8674E|nr:hypothetical protein [Streptomyces sp. HUAS 15-9]UXY32117.1 hypothetical protein N8I87_39970 [Streptomyces sp. HUAS 15-9]
MSNDTSSTFCLWVEPWGTDHWMCPGEAFTVVTETEPEQSAFNVVVHDQGVTVRVNSGGDAEVFHKNREPVPRGHQQPAEGG